MSGDADLEAAFRSSWCGPVPGISRSLWKMVMEGRQFTGLFTDTWGDIVFVSAAHQPRIRKIAAAPIDVSYRGGRLALRQGAEDVFVPIVFTLDDPAQRAFIDAAAEQDYIAGYWIASDEGTLIAYRPRAIAGLDALLLAG